ncbi:MAG: transcriptional initiation protein Tat, partial [Myxococcales bacterium]
KELPDAGGQNVLYNSAIFCSSDISDGNRHNHDDMPIVLAGHGGGKLTPGQHISFTPPNRTAPKQKVSDLLVTMFEAAGVTGAQVGDSTGPLAGL